MLSCIAPSPKTLPAILEKTRDVKDTVRKTAFNILGEKVHIKALSIANRERLLQEGLTDRVGGSFFRMCASQMFIQLVGVNSIVVSLLFTVIYNEIDPPLLINNFSTISNVSSLQIISI